MYNDEKDSQRGKDRRSNPTREVRSTGMEKTSDMFSSGGALDSQTTESQWEDTLPLEVYFKQLKERGYRRVDGGLWISPKGDFFDPSCIPEVGQGTVNEAITISNSEDGTGAAGEDGVNAKPVKVEDTDTILEVNETCSKKGDDSDSDKENIEPKTVTVGILPDIMVIPCDNIDCAEERLFLRKELTYQMQFLGEGVSLLNGLGHNWSDRRKELEDALWRMDCERRSKEEHQRRLKARAKEFEAKLVQIYGSRAMKRGLGGDGISTSADSVSGAEGTDSDLSDLPDLEPVEEDEEGVTRSGPKFHPTLLYCTPDRPSSSMIAAECTERHFKFCSNCSGSSC